MSHFTCVKRVCQKKDSWLWRNKRKWGGCSRSPQAASEWVQHLQAVKVIYAAQSQQYIFWFKHLHSVDPRAACKNYPLVVFHGWAQPAIFLKLVQSNPVWTLYVQMQMQALVDAQLDGFTTSLGERAALHALWPSRIQGHGWIHTNSLIILSGFKSGLWALFHNTVLASVKKTV